MVIERQTLNERRKSLQQEHERLLDAQVSLNQREDHIFARSQELAELEKGLDTAKTTFEEERKAFEDKKSNLEIALALCAKREEVCFYSHNSLLFLVLHYRSSKKFLGDKIVMFSCFFFFFAKNRLSLKGNLRYLRRSKNCLLLKKKLPARNL